MKLINNHTCKSKDMICEMFDNIADKYDFINNLLTLGIDAKWRESAITKVGNIKNFEIIDIATGTADIAIKLCLHGANRVTAVDISDKMLLHAQLKINKYKLNDKISLVKADCENMPFENNKFDLAIISFGIRNFENPLKALKEVYRILKPASKIIILEFSYPDNIIGKFINKYYVKNALNIVGEFVAHNKVAYNYLYNSINEFPKGDAFLDLMRLANFCDLSIDTNTAGIVSIYSGVKRLNS
ncbi:MAG TPA: bifunctional demethylmenaquinone methyltransferase/2-methoxy-6-polyprenyl-1,4-benzoquinol methylase UbiE [Bacteroidales bacterium]|nr:bifunctional demethylmenaquinone methyltransferase/2-methoxy-6-polyprenyl-1,4-benzoquinol methylase UbiE [Bacteroidales bacterium]